MQVKVNPKKWTKWTVVKRQNGKWEIGGSCNLNDYKKTGQAWNIKTTLGKGGAISIAKRLDKQGEDK